MSWNRSALAAILIVSSWVTLWGCGSSSEILAQTKQCTVDADCSGSGWCLDGVCQTPYGLTLSIDKAPSADGKIHASGILNMSVTVTGGAPPVEIGLVDGGRLPGGLVAAPYAYAWDTKVAPAGSQRLVATAKGGTRIYTSQAVEVIVDNDAPQPPKVVPPVASPTKKGTSADPLTVAGTAEEKARVSIKEGSTELAGVDVQAGGGWTVDLKNLTEGTHNLVVTATDLAGNTSQPEPLTVVVDHTQPTVVKSSRVPEPGSGNVWWRDPMTVTFSEPVSKATAENDAAVQLVATGGTAIAKTLSLSGDGLTLAIKFPAPPPSLNLTVTAILNSSITDLAGNALIPLPPADVWSWELPVWQGLGNPIASSARYVTATAKVAVGRDGTPVVALSTVVPNAMVVSVMKWTDGAWLKQYAIPPMTYPPSADMCAADLDLAGNPVVAWVEAGVSVYAAIWNGSAWLGSASALNIVPSAAASNPSVKVDGSGGAVVAWLENGGVFVRRWNGTAWVQLGTTQLNTSTASNVVVRVDALGQPLVSWVEGTYPTLCVSGWDPGSGNWLATRSWALLGFATGGPWVAASATAAGRPFTVSLDSSGPVPLARVYQFSQAGGPPSWSTFGPALNVNPTQAASWPTIALDGDGHPVAAWVEGSAPGSLYVKRWDGTAWQQLGPGNVDPSTGTTGPRSPSVATGADGTVVVLWTTGITSPIPQANTAPIYGMRYNR